MALNEIIDLNLLLNKSEEFYHHERGSTLQIYSYESGLVVEIHLAAKNKSKNWQVNDVNKNETYYVQEGQLKYDIPIMIGINYLNHF